MPNSILLPDLENFYDELAEHIDLAGPDKSRLFLAKLALQLASEVKEPVKLRQALEIALADI